MDKKQIITTEDAVENGVRDDVIPQEAERVGAETSTNKSGQSPADRPLTWSEQRDSAKAVEATLDVPEELRSLWSNLAVLKPFEVERIDRKTNNEPQLISGHRPLWVGASLKPKAAARSTRPRVQHRGILLDPLVVWGNDERKIYDDTRYPWGCVCRILNAGGTGSGVLVGPRHILTASHVIDWSSKRASIEVHRAGAAVQATARAVRTLAFTRVIDNDNTSLDEDYAVIVTDQRLGDRFGWMGTRNYDSDWDGEDYWWNIGYPEDIEETYFPVWQHRQNLDEDEWDLGAGRAMTTSADVYEGQSGGPIFGFWDSSPYVVAVVAAQGSVFASGTENWCSGGSLLTQLVAHARSKYP